MQVEQNAFKPGSLNSYVFPAESRFGGRGFEGGNVIDRFNEIRGAAAKGVSLKTRVEGTMMKVDLSAPLAPGQTTTFDVAWHFTIPEHGADRMGRDGSLYELAQWYPRMPCTTTFAGWNTEPYLGQGEFYLEYGDYTIDVTVPAGYIVAATGTLQNAAEVLPPTQIARLAQAAKSETPVNIITQQELASGAARPKKTGCSRGASGRTTSATPVWAASPQYMWDASSWKGDHRQCLLSAERDRDMEGRGRHVANVHHRVLGTLVPLPYPQISAVEGPISGMEYPMVAMENKSADKYDLYNVVTHEIGHMWYPMIVGSNERMHMWQDEGFNTFINYFSEARRYPEKGDVKTRAGRDREQVAQYMEHDVDVALEIAPDRINPQLLGENAYVKTAVGLSLLREEILGPAAFDDAFREYTRRWAFKHPSPADFFKTMEDVSGKRLDWFFREWFLENLHFDQAIDTVATKQSGDTMYVGVRFANRARGVLPIHARFTFSDGSVENIDYPAEVWSTNTTYYVREYAYVGKKLVKIELDPEKRLIDLNRDNNSWPAGGR
jgi:hypothetical protein